MLGRRTAATLSTAALLLGSCADAPNDRAARTPATAPQSSFRTGRLPVKVNYSSSYPNGHDTITLLEARDHMIDTYRLLPDRRFLEAIADVHQLVTGKAKQPVSVEFRHDKWHVNYEGEEAMVISEFADFDELFAALTGYAKKDAAANKFSLSQNCSQGHGEEQLLCAHFGLTDPIRALEMIDENWKKGDRCARELKIAAHAWVKLVCQTSDTFELSESTRSRALSTLALACAYDVPGAKEDIEPLRFKLDYGVQQAEKAKDIETVIRRINWFATPDQVGSELQLLTGFSMAYRQLGPSRKAQVAVKLAATKFIGKDPERSFAMLQPLSWSRFTGSRVRAYAAIMADCLRQVDRQSSKLVKVWEFGPQTPLPADLTQLLPRDLVQEFETKVGQLKTPEGEFLDADSERMLFRGYFYSAVAGLAEQYHTYLDAYIYLQGQIASGDRQPIPALRQWLSAKAALHSNQDLLILQRSLREAGELGDGALVSLMSEFEDKSYNPPAHFELVPELAHTACRACDCRPSNRISLRDFAPQLMAFPEWSHNLNKHITEDMETTAESLTSPIISGDTLNSDGEPQTSSAVGPQRGQRRNHNRRRPMNQQINAAATPQPNGTAETGSQGPAQFASLHTQSQSLILRNGDRGYGTAGDGTAGDNPEYPHRHRHHHRHASQQGEPDARAGQTIRHSVDGGRQGVQAASGAQPGEPGRQGMQAASGAQPVEAGRRGIQAASGAQPVEAGRQGVQAASGAQPVDPGNAENPRPRALRRMARRRERLANSLREEFDPKQNEAQVAPHSPIHDPNEGPWMIESLTRKMRVHSGITMVVLPSLCWNLIPKGSQDIAESKYRKDLASMNEKSEDYLPTVCALVVVLAREHKVAEATRLLQPIIDSDRIDRMVASAEIAEAAGDKSAAESWARETAKAYPNQGPAVAASLYWRNGRYREAAEVLKRFETELSREAWATHIAYAFLDALPTEPQRAKAAQELIAAGLGDQHHLGSIIPVAHLTGKPDAAFQLMCMVQTNDRANQTIACYADLKQWKGDKEANEWLIPRLQFIPPALLAPMGFTYGCPELLWMKSASSQDDLIWVLRAAFKAFSPISADQERELKKHFEQSSSLSDRTGRMLLGTDSDSSYSKMPVQLAEVSPAAFFLAWHKFTGGVSLDEGSTWLRLCWELSNPNGGRMEGQWARQWLHGLVLMSLLPRSGDVPVKLDLRRGNWHFAPVKINSK